jgi:hypothetical protein
MFVDQVLAQRKVEISKFLPGYFVPLPPEPRFQSVEEVKAKYGDKVSSYSAKEDAEEKVTGELKQQTAKHVGSRESRPPVPVFRHTQPNKCIYMVVTFM